MDKNKIQIGDLVTFKYENGKEEQLIITDQYYLTKIKQSDYIKIYQVKRPKYEVIEEKKELLTDEERKYLRNVIKPYYNRVSHIIKEGGVRHEFINITLKDEEIWLPIFSKNTMYKGLKLGKEYTLKELRFGGRSMNKDKYNEIINGEETYKEIVNYLKKGQPIMIGWTDEEYMHYDILFVYKTNKEYGNIFQRGLRPTDLFISIMGWSSFGFKIDNEKSPEYIAEKLNISGEKTKEKIAELINGVIKKLEEEDE